DRHRLLEAAAAHGGIDLLVNNASELGDTPLPPLVEASRETFLRVFEVNTLAPLALVREALPLLRRGTGLVVNISSDAAIGGYPGWGTYGASKAALDLVSKTLAAELKDQGIAVVSGDPGEPPRRGTPRLDPPEPLHPIPVRPLDRGTPLGGGEARPTADRARGGTPNRSCDGPPLVTVSGNPAAVVRPRGPSV